VGRLVCIDATQTGDITATGIIWSYQDIKRSISTVSITPGGLLFIGDFSGFLHCLDAETGKVHWVYDTKAHMWGSTLVADGKVYVGDEDGDFVILAASQEKKVLSETNLGSPIYSSPIVANGVLYVGTQSHLYGIYDAARATANLDKAPNVNRHP
jgi:outer membrane protein assembly factor BamB